LAQRSGGTRAMTDTFAFGATAMNPDEGSAL
jgi:hypothetical protein